MFAVVCSWVAAGAGGAPSAADPVGAAPAGGVPAVRVPLLPPTIVGLTSAFGLPSATVTVATSVFFPAKSWLGSMPVPFKSPGLLATLAFSNGESFGALNNGTSLFLGEVSALKRLG